MERIAIREKVALISVNVLNRCWRAPITGITCARNMTARPAAPTLEACSADNRPMAINDCSDSADACAMAPCAIITPCICAATVAQPSAINAQAPTKARPAAQRWASLSSLPRRRPTRITPVPATSPTAGSSSVTALPRSVSAPRVTTTSPSAPIRTVPMGPPNCHFASLPAPMVTVSPAAAAVRANSTAQHTSASHMGSGAMDRPENVSESRISSDALGTASSSCDSPMAHPAAPRASVNPGMIRNSGAGTRFLKASTATRMKFSPSVSTTPASTAYIIGPPLATM